jgi:fucose 4-O-acetylase-like acetyltransferase
MKIMKKNLIHLVLPFIVCTTLYSIFQILVKNGELSDTFNYWLSDTKGGGWFLLTLFTFIVVMEVLKIILEIIKINHLLVRILLFLLPLFFVVALSFVVDDKLYNALSMPSFRRYWLLFVAGFFIRNLYGTDFIKRKKTLVISTIGYIPFATYYTLYVGGITNNVDFIIWLTTNLFGCLFWLSLFEKLSSNYTVPNIILYIGRNTLGLYLLHYFFFCIYTTFIYPSMSAEFLSPYICYLVMLFVSFIILFLTLICVKVFDKFPVTSLLLFGKIKKKI